MPAKRLIAPTLLMVAGRLLAADLTTSEDFSGALDNGWSQGGERIAFEGGLFRTSADNPAFPRGGWATAWWTLPHAADFDLVLDAHARLSSDEANNIHLFLCYSDPSGQPLVDTQESRRIADYGLYHTLNGYIISFLNATEGQGRRTADGSTKAGMRIRRNSGFQLLKEAYINAITSPKGREGVTNTGNIVLGDAPNQGAVRGRGREEFVSLNWDGEKHVVTPFIGAPIEKAERTFLIDTDFTRGPHTYCTKQSCGMLGSVFKSVATLARA